MTDGEQLTLQLEPTGSSPFGPANCSLTVIALTGHESKDQCKDIAWQMFCNAHPIEAHKHDPEKFWRYFHSRAPNVSREQMVALLKECEEPESPNDQAQARRATDK